jgi:DNA-binding transcriptional regulator YiaG
MIDIIKELAAVMEEKQISPETAARFLDCSGRQVRRWLEGHAVPNLTSRKKIRVGMRRIKRML